MKRLFDITVRGESPWWWIPTLYVAEGLPYFAVNTLTVLMFSRLGMGKTEMALLTGWLYLPWVIKPFWSPFVDLIRTKRWWILTMQALLAVSMLSVAFALQTSAYTTLCIVAFFIMAFASATHDIAADGFYILELDTKLQAAYVGVRSTFYRIASVLGQGALVVFAGWMETKCGNLHEAWGLTFLLLSVFFSAVFFYHLKFLPVAELDQPSGDTTAREVCRGFLNAFLTFFRKPGIVAALCFMLLYRFPEALCIKMVQPFLVDPHEAGGLALTTAQVGIVNGTVGVISLLAGGIVGGVTIARYGLKECIWWMAAALTLPCFVYCWLAAMQPDSFLSVSVLLGIEQFGYGFGFTAYMMYLMLFAQGENTTSHYAFCTAFMALGMMLPGMAAGWLFDHLRELPWLNNASWFGGQAGINWFDNPYTLFFLLVFLTSAITFAVIVPIYRKLPGKK